MAEERTVWVRVKAILDEFTKGFKEGMAEAEQAAAKSASKIEKDFSGLEKTISNFGKNVRNVGLGMSAALTAPLTMVAKQSVQDFAEASRAVADLEAALASTGGRAGVTSEQLQKFANDAQFKTLYQDEEILKSVSANLLRFGNISGDTFMETQQLAIDLSARLGKDLSSSATILGKALNDPASGLGALRKAGIQFTDEQEAMIKKMAEAGDIAGAQKAMIDELKKSYAGSAEAVASAGDLGPLNEFNKQMAEIRETIGGILVEIGTPLLEMLNGWLEAFRGLSPETQKMIVYVAGIVAVAGPLLAILGPIISGMAALAPVIAALASPVGLVIAAIAGISIVLNEFGITFEQQWNAIVALFNGIVEQFKLSIQFLKQLFTGDLTGALATLSQMWSNYWQTMANFINALLPGLLESISQWAQNIVTSISDAWSGLSEYVTTTWTAITTAITTAATNILTAIQNMGTMALEAVSSMVTAIIDWMTNKLQGAWDTTISGIHAVNDAFAWLRNQVTGNSHIPDMVDEIGQNMNRLGDNMVKPAQEATSAVDQLFSGLADTVKSYIADFIKTGKFDIESFMADISGKLIDWGLDMIFKNLLGGLGGGTGTGLLGGLFAEGGNPPLNKPSIVGENGPELFIPKVRGTVVSNRESQRMLNNASNTRTQHTGGNNTWNVSVYAKDVDSFRNTETSIGRSMRRQAELGMRGA